MLQQTYHEMLDLLDEELLEFNLINNQLKNISGWLTSHKHPEVRQRGQQIQQLTNQIDDFLDKVFNIFQHHLQLLKPHLLSQNQEQQNFLAHYTHLEYLLIQLSEINKLIQSFGEQSSMIKSNLEMRKQHIIKEIEEFRKHKHPS